MSCGAVCMCWSHPLPRKEGQDAMSVGHKGRPDLPRWTVGQARAETGLDIWLVLSRKIPCPYMLVPTASFWI